MGCILVVSVFCVTACRASSFSPLSAWQPSWLSLESDMKIAGTHPPPRDISQYRPRGDMFPMDAATAAAMPKQTPRQRSPITKSIYNLAEECGVEGPPADNKIVGGDEAAPHQYPWIVGDGVVCVDTTGGHSSCNGDSGGPLMVPQSSVKEAGQKWDQVGIVSFGSSAGCEKGYPAAFTRTEYYREWIETNSGV